MSERVAELLSAAMVECEKEKNAALETQAPGQSIPRKWFAYDGLQRRIKPLYHAAEQEARRV